MIKQNLSVINASIKRILKSDTSTNQKLNALQDLRDNLRDDYQLTLHKTEVLFPQWQQDIDKAVDKIDKAWWRLFTKGGVTDGQVHRSL